MVDKTKIADLEVEQIGGFAHLRVCSAGGDSVELRLPARAAMRLSLFYFWIALRAWWHS